MTPPPAHAAQAALRPRHLAMLALGGVAGSGLFVGTGAGLAAASPAATLGLAIMRMPGERMRASTDPARGAGNCARSDHGPQPSSLGLRPRPRSA
ncbi:hypothetical protein ABR738_31010 [Streptomyces sp. Edi4]|uniref:hypothetical protein n=1 Tax=Streptomyces sp. Edi4 TaxID=3162527 RepID=UPI003305D698